MSLEFCVLGSGSSGNSTVVRASRGAFLIDAGFGPRATEQRLHGTGLTVKDLSAIVLTHLDSDHFNGNWLLTIARQGIKIHLARHRVRDFLKLPEVRDLQARTDKQALWDDASPEQNQKSKTAGPGAPVVENRKSLHPIESLLVPFTSDLEPLEGVRLKAIQLAHDQTGSHGFVLESGDYRAGYATDLGTVPEALIEAFCGVDFLALEANYDPDMELHSDRPYYLKQRIMGGTGHLSNEQAFTAIRTILDRTAQLTPNRLPRHVVLLHRSRQCNCPNLLTRLFTSDPRIAPILTLTSQHERTPWLHPARPRAQHVQQLALAWG